MLRIQAHINSSQQRFLLEGFGEGLMPVSFGSFSDDSFDIRPIW